MDDVLIDAEYIAFARAALADERKLPGAVGVLVPFAEFAALLDIAEKE